jgi:hypothetical protein
LSTDAPQSEPSNALVIPTSGVLVNLENEREVAIAFRDLRKVRDELTHIDRILREALVARAELTGTKTFHIDGVGKIQIKGDTIVEYDAAAVEDGLRDLGCPENIIREIVKETITYKVDGNRARRAAAANPEYAKVIEAARTVYQKPPTVSIA